MSDLERVDSNLILLGTLLSRVVELGCGAIAAHQLFLYLFEPPARAPSGGFPRRLSELQSDGLAFDEGVDLPLSEQHPG